MHYVHYVHQSFAFYHDRGTKKLARTSCWYVPGRIVRMSSAILGQMKDLLGINICARHLLYFIIARISLGCLDHTPFTMTKSLKNSAGRLVGMSPDM